MTNEKRTITLKDLPFEPNPDELIYIEGRPNVAINRVLRLHWRELDEQFTADYGLRFWYLPLAHQRVNNDQLRWYAPWLSVRTARRVVQEPLFSLLDYEEGTHHKHAMPPAICRLSTADDYYSEHRVVLEYVELANANERNYFDVFNNAVRQLIQPAADEDADESFDDLPILSSVWRGIDGLRHQPEEAESFDVDNDFCLFCLDLLAEAKQRINQLRAMGVDQMVLNNLVSKKYKVSSMLITSDLRILLPEYGNIEIEMTPLVKSVYILFLRHRDGIMFKHLPAHRDELAEIYRRVRGSELTDKNRRSIEEVTDPTCNSIHEKCARVREAFLLKMRDILTYSYIIEGARNIPKWIMLDRRLVIWETDINKHLPAISDKPEFFHKSFIESATFV